MLSNIKDFVLARALRSLLFRALQSTKFCICGWFVVRTFGVTPDLHAERVEDCRARAVPSTNQLNRPQTLRAWNLAHVAGPKGCRQGML